MSRPITVIAGDGIGPEITRATLRALEALGCGLEYEHFEAGLAALERGQELLPPETLASIRRTGVVLKGPLTTPVGKGFSSINVTPDSKMIITRKGSERLTRFAFELARREGRHKVTLVQGQHSESRFATVPRSGPRSRKRLP